MKFTKSQFKSLLKECLAELIQEGAFDSKLETIAEAKMAIVKEQARSTANDAGMSNTITGGDVGKNVAMMNAIGVLARGTEGKGMWTGKKSLFEEILKDTAQNTLQKQLREDGLANFTTPEEKKMNEMQLEALSGGDPGRWARVVNYGKKRM